MAVSARWAEGSSSHSWTQRPCKRCPASRSEPAARSRSETNVDALDAWQAVQRCSAISSRPCSIWSCVSAAVSSWVGMGSSVKSRPSQSSRIQAGPLLGGVHSRLIERSPLFRRSCLVFNSVLKSPSSTASSSMESTADPVPRRASSARVRIGRLRVPEKTPDHPVGSIPTAGESPASIRAANKRVGRIR